jgi:hypothetical protein
MPYDDLGETPNIIVDGQRTGSTVLTLSHWLQSGTPAEYKDDSSTQIVFRYLDRPSKSADVVSNNHFDEDGVLGIYALLSPDHALRHRELLIDASLTGDFQICRSRRAARLAYTIAAFANPKLSPFGADFFDRPYAKVCADLYNDVLERMPELIEHPERFESFWGPEERAYDASMADIRSGRIRIQEVPSLDLSVVEGPPANTVALYSSIEGFRVLLGYEFRYRYESWVQYMSRRPLPRVDLAFDGWEFDGVDQTTPSLRPIRPPAISTAEFRRRLELHLASSPPAWNPYLT